MVKAKTLEAEKVLLEADGFRLGVDPTPDDVHTANWLIDRLSSMAQPVTPQEAARVLLDAMSIAKAQEVVSIIKKAHGSGQGYLNTFYAALRAIAEPPQSGEGE